MLSPTPLVDTLRAVQKEMVRRPVPPRKAPLDTKVPMAALPRRPNGTAAALARSGLLAAPSLISQAPLWWRPPPEVKVAAHTFDTRHRALVARAEKALEAVGADPESKKKQICFSRSVQGVKGNRYFVPEKVQAVAKAIKVVKRQTHEVVGKVWKLETSIWGPRRKEADSKSFHDGEDVLLRCLETDWKLALNAHNTTGFMASNDKTADVDAIASTCFDVLVDAVVFVYGAYDYYATIGASEDILHVSKAGYKQLIADCSLVVPGSKHCNPLGFDQLFVLLNSISDYPLALNRQEWLQMLVRMAARRYLFNGEMDSLPLALDWFISEDLMPKVDKRSLQDTSSFRAIHCYIQDVDEVLLDFEPSLRALFAVYARGDGNVGDVLKSNTMLDYLEWRLLLRDLQLIDDDFRDREAALTFSWSRMRVVDERPLLKRAKLTQLTFVDFLDCLVRMATLKALPSQEQIFDADCEDAGDFILRMRGTPDEYARFIAGNVRPWGEPLPEDESVHLILVSFIYVILRTVKKYLADHDKKGFKSTANAKGTERDELTLDEKQVNRFKHLNFKKLGDNPFSSV